MRNLLQAETRRLFRSKTFRIVAVINCLIGIFLQGMLYLRTVREHFEATFDGMLFVPFLFMGYLIVIAVSMIVGTEWSDGTLRNKLIIGHSRVKLYFVYLYVAELASILWMIAYWIGFSISGILLFGTKTSWTADEVFLRIGVFAVSMLAYTAIYLLILVISQNKSLTAILAFCVAIAMWFAAVAIQSRLNEPEYYDDYVMAEDGGIEVKGNVKNEYYLSGKKREAYELVLQILPAGQAVITSGGFEETENASGYMAVYSALIVAGCSLGSILIFRKKDIK